MRHIIVLLCLFLLGNTGGTPAIGLTKDQEPTLKDDMKALAAGRGWWELTGDDKKTPTIKLFYLKVRKEEVVGQLIVWGPGASTAQAAFAFRLAEKDKKRFITGVGAAFSRENAENVFSYKFVDGKLVLEGGTAHGAIIGTIRLKGEWKWVADKK